MLNGLLIVNAFLKTTKFDEIYNSLLEAAQKCGIKLSLRTNAQLSTHISMPSFHASDYDFVLFWDKDITLAMQLEQIGLPVFNSARGILACDDKSLTYLTLHKAGIPMPKTIILPKTFPRIGYPNTEFIDEAAEILGFPLVLKECFGSFGKQVYRFDSVDTLKDKVLSLAGTPMILQSLVQSSYGRDIRINVVGDRVVASILRQSQTGDFRSNLTLGGTMQNYLPTQEEASLALNAVKELGLTFAGVDVLFGEDHPIICEVNSNAHFKTTLTCTGINMAEEIFCEIKNRIR